MLQLSVCHWQICDLLLASADNNGRVMRYRFIASTNKEGMLERLL